MPVTPETRSINRRLESAIISLFTTANATVPISFYGDGTFVKPDLYCMVHCRELNNINLPCLNDYTASIDIYALSQTVKDKSGVQADALLKKIQDFIRTNLTKSALSTASGFTIDNIAPEMVDHIADDKDFHVKSVSLKIWMQNAF